MKTDYTHYIVIGIWCAGIILGIYLLRGLCRLLYRVLIRPWWKNRLTMADLNNRRKYTANPENPLMKLAKLIIWVVGLIFAGLMIWGIILNLKHNFDGALIKQEILEVSSKLNKKNIDHIREQIDIEKAIKDAGTTREEFLKDIELRINAMENTQGGIHSLPPQQQAEYETLRAMRDVLNGNIPSLNTP